ncbi:MAG: tetratricopeptide repeat protein, partial [Vicinamibacterales bacterium]
MGARTVAPMAWDAKTGDTVLFGGSGGPCADTWAWNGVRWRPLTGEPTPGRFNSVAAFDAARGQISSKRLGALGYVGGTAPATTATPGADPKDRIADFRRANELMREGILALNRKEYAGSARRFQELIDAGIESFEGHLYLVRALMGQRRPDRAAVHFEQAARRAPALEEAWTGWAEAWRALAGPAAGLAVVREGRGHNPKSSRLWILEAELCVRLQRPREAIVAYEAALPLVPKDASLRQRLGELLRDAGQVDAALERLREAVAVDPTNAAAWNALGMTLGGNSRLDEAEQA